MFDEEMNRSLLDITIQKLNLFENQKIYFVDKLQSNCQFDEIVKNKPNLISFDNDHRLIVNIEHVDNDYLLKSTKETTS